MVGIMLYYICTLCSLMYTVYCIYSKHICRYVYKVYLYIYHIYLSVIYRHKSIGIQTIFSTTMLLPTAVHEMEGLLICIGASEDSRENSFVALSPA